MVYGKLSEEQLDARSHALLFGVRRSIRYHEDRAAWFAKVFTGLPLAAAAGLFALHKAGCGLQPLDLLLALALAGTMAVIYARGRGHRKLAQAFTRLDGKIPERTLTDEEHARFHGERCSLEEKERDFEPKTMALLNVRCHYEELAASGDPEGGAAGLNAIHPLRHALRNLFSMTRYALNVPGTISKGAKLTDGEAQEALRQTADASREAMEEALKDR